jgi:hypothetical protein
MISIVCVNAFGGSTFLSVLLLVVSLRDALARLKMENIWWKRRINTPGTNNNPHCANQRWARGIM